MGVRSGRVGQDGGQRPTPQRAGHMVLVDFENASPLASHWTRGAGQTFTLQGKQVLRVILRTFRHSAGSQQDDMGPTKQLQDNPVLLCAYMFGGEVPSWNPKWAMSGGLLANWSCNSGDEPAHGVTDGYLAIVNRMPSAGEPAFRISRLQAHFQPSLPSICICYSRSHVAFSLATEHLLGRYSFSPGFSRLVAAESNSRETTL